MYVLAVTTKEIEPNGAGVRVWPRRLLPVTPGDEVHLVIGDTSAGRWEVSSAMLMGEELALDLWPLPVDPYWRPIPAESEGNPGEPGEEG